MATRRLSTWWWLWIAGMTLAVIAALARYADLSGSGSSSAGYPTRTVDVGAVAVSLRLASIDASSATVEVSFGTHSGSLDVDVAHNARLTVGGVAWPSASWRGDGPGGHHRKGDMRFSAAGPARGTVTFTLTGLEQPATATWQVTR